MAKQFIGDYFNDIIPPKFVNTSKDKFKSEISPDLEIEIQAKLLAETYGTTVFGIHDIEKVLGIGEKKVRKLLEDGELKAVSIGARRVVSAVTLAKFTLGIPT